MMNTPLAGGGEGEGAGSPAAALRRRESGRSERVTESPVPVHNFLSLPSLLFLPNCLLQVYLSLSWLALVF
jgi:hypothetical protein